MAGCNLPLDEGAVFLPPRVEARPGNGDGQAIRNEAALDAAIRHDRVSAGALSIAVTHIHRPAQDPDAPLILLCMGNATDRIHGGAAYAANLLDHGDVLLFDYPGYGDSSGTPTADNLMAIRSALMRHSESVAHGRAILLWGHSLGAFVCSQIVEASDRISGIVLETSAVDAEEVAAAIRPWYLPFIRIQIADSLVGFNTPDAL